MLGSGNLRWGSGDDGEWYCAWRSVPRPEEIGDGGDGLMDSGMLMCCVVVRVDGYADGWLFSPGGNGSLGGIVVS